MVTPDALFTLFGMSDHFFSYSYFFLFNFFFSPPHKIILASRVCLFKSFALFPHLFDFRVVDVTRTHAIIVTFKNKTGVYGDVHRVKILFNKKDTALIQMAEPHQAQLGGSQFFFRFGRPHLTFLLW